MAAYQYMLGPDTKTNISTALGAATLSQATGMDPGASLNPSDATLVAQFAGAIASAQAQLAVLTGPATKAKVTITGYRDSVTVGAMFTAGSKLTVSVIEMW